MNEKKQQAAIRNAARAKLNEAANNLNFCHSANYPLLSPRLVSQCKTLAAEIKAVLDKDMQEFEAGRGRYPSGVIRPRKTQ